MYYSILLAALQVTFAFGARLSKTRFTTLPPAAACGVSFLGRYRIEEFSCVIQFALLCWLFGIAADADAVPLERLALRLLGYAAAGNAEKHPPAAKPFE